MPHLNDHQNQTCRQSPTRVRRSHRPHRLLAGIAATWLTITGCSTDRDPVTIPENLTTAQQILELIDTHPGPVRATIQGTTWTTTEQSTNPDTGNQENPTGKLASPTVNIITYWPDGTFTTEHTRNGTPTPVLQRTDATVYVAKQTRGGNVTWRTRPDTDDTPATISDHLFHTNLDTWTIEPAENGYTLQQTEPDTNDGKPVRTVTLHVTPDRTLAEATVTTRYTPAGTTTGPQTTTRITFTYPNEPAPSAPAAVTHRKDPSQTKHVRDVEPHHKREPDHQTS